jgi:hypothetical protein
MFAAGEGQIAVHGVEEWSESGAQAEEFVLDEANPE